MLEVVAREFALTGDEPAERLCASTSDLKCGLAVTPLAMEHDTVRRVT
jgi:hypothetical protein